LQSTRAIELVCFPARSSLPRDFTFYVADPISSIRSQRFLGLFAGTHDRELLGTPKRSKPSIAPLMHHKRLMMRSISVENLWQGTPLAMKSIDCTKGRKVCFGSQPKPTGRRPVLPRSLPRRQWLI
jgi:hypothetical protein